MNFSIFDAIVEVKNFLLFQKLLFYNFVNCMNIMLHFHVFLLLFDKNKII